jgi:hypothetical protein
MNIKHYTYVDSALGQGCQMAYFQTQKSQFEYILEGLAMEEVDIFCCHVVYFTRFGIFCGLWVHFYKHKYKHEKMSTKLTTCPPASVSWRQYVGK